VIFKNHGIRVRGGIGFSVNNVGYNELASVLPKKNNSQQSDEIATSTMTLLSLFVKLSCGNSTILSSAI
jgi:hypothetical protein